MRVAVSGSNGLIGSALCHALSERGDQVVRLVRRQATRDEEAQWIPGSGIVDIDRVEGLDAVVHLAGAGIADGRWTAKRKEILWNSRIDGTHGLIDSLASLAQPPRRFLGGSAIGYYGNRGAERLDESSRPGSGFLADLCVAWEQEIDAASAFADRVFALRTGIVLSVRGGALRKMLLPFKLGLGGRIGSGEQYMSWIGIGDEVGAIVHLLEADLASGPVNLTGTNPVTNKIFTEALGRVLRRRTPFPIPAFMVKALFGQMGTEALLGSQCVLPRRLQAARYRFTYPDLELSLRLVLGRE